MSEGNPVDTNPGAQAAAPAEQPAPQQDTLQQVASAVEQVGLAAATPFIHSQHGQSTEQKVVTEVNLGIAALPLLESLWHAIYSLFHHAKTVAAKAQAAPPEAPKS